jgi:Complex 1 protein (LYR family)
VIGVSTGTIGGDESINQKQVLPFVLVHCSSVHHNNNNGDGRFNIIMVPLSLYRALIRQGQQVKDYNFRSYAIRRTKAGFRRNRNLRGYVRSLCCAFFFTVTEVVRYAHTILYSSHVFFMKFVREEAAAALRDGEEQLKILQRQAVVSQLYPSARSVME